jgi:hypothetical protein
MQQAMAMMGGGGGGMPDMSALMGGLGGMGGDGGKKKGPFKVRCGSMSTSISSRLLCTPEGRISCLTPSYPQTPTLYATHAQGYEDEDA